MCREKAAEALTEKHEDRSSEYKPGSSEASTEPAKERRASGSISDKDKPPTQKGSLPPSNEGLEGIDPAIADALKAPKNRQTVLRFEEDVLAFLRSDEEALLFPLTLSGYQRLLAHRTAQYHGLQTATVDDGKENHGKIKATRTQPATEAKPPLASISVPEPPEEHKEQQKVGRKKSADRQSRRDRDSASVSRALHDEGILNRVREQASLRGGFADHDPFSAATYAHPQFPGSHLIPSYAALGGAGGRPGFGPGLASGSLESDFWRSASLSQEQPKEQGTPLQPQSGPGSQPGGSRRSDPAAAPHMPVGFGLHQAAPGGQHMGLGGLQGYTPMHVPFAYVPGPGGIPQAVPNLQGMGMYGSMHHAMAFGGYGMPVPYPYYPGRPVQQQVVPQMMGHPPGPGMMPVYPGLQGYPVPYAGIPMPPASVAYSNQQSSTASTPQGSVSGLEGRRASLPGLSAQRRGDSGFSSSSTVRQRAESAESSGSVSGDATPTHSQ